MVQETQRKGTLRVWLMLSAIAVFVLCAFASSNSRRVVRNGRERGSLAHAEQLQQMLASYADQYGWYPDATRLKDLMTMMRPLYPGVLNTRTNLPTEPRTVNSMEPGALIYSVSQDCCTDTIAVVGEDRTVIWTIVGTVGHGYAIYGTTPPRRQENTRPAVGTFPHSSEDH